MATTSTAPASRLLGRGLAVLCELNRRRIASATEIGAAIGVPRPTVHRLLLALAAEGYARQLDAGKFFTPAARVIDLASGWDAQARALAIAAPLVDEMARTVQWPIDLATFDDGDMVVRHSTHDRAGWSLMPGSPVGRRIPLHGTAPGRIFLAGLDPSRREPLLEGAALEERQEVETAARRGFAVRNGGVMPRTASIAAAIIFEGVTLVCVSMAFIRSAISLDQAIATHVPILTTIVCKTEQELTAGG